MKITNVANAILQIDTTHQRIDLKQVEAHVLVVLIVAIGVLISGPVNGLYHFATRFGVMLLFVILARLLLGRLGTSRLSSLLLTVAALSVCLHFALPAIMLLCIYLALLLLVQEYFILQSKLVALVIAVISGALIAGAGHYGRGLLTVMVFVILARLLWHAVVERMGRKTFVIYVVKTTAVALITPAIYYGAHRVAGGYTYDLPSSPPVVHLMPLAWAVIGVLALRGLWATLLLKTDRSPSYRPLRMFYILFGIGYGVLALGVERYGQRVFTPDTMQVLHSMGLQGITISSAAYGFFALALLATTGVGRSLYKDTTTIRKLSRFLQLPTPTTSKMSRSK